MNTPLVTIGIPCYNVGRFIALSIKSVLAQTYSNFELIITDDGSTDNTVEEIRKFDDPRIKLIVDGENHGISYRLNQQIDMARGQFFVRMDGDDIMFSDRIEKQIKFLLDNPNVDVVGSSAVIIDTDNSVTGIRINKNSHYSMKDMLRITRYIHPTVTGRTKWFKKYHYKEQYNGCEDKNLWIRAFNDSNMQSITDPLMFYRDSMQLKLPTYLFRMKQVRQMILGERNVINNSFWIFEEIIRNYLKTAIVFIACKMRMEYLIVAKRSCSLNTKDFNHYTNLINYIIHHKKR